MICLQCGCRRVAKSALIRSSLVCVDCGHPADLRTTRVLSGRAWRASLALAGFTLFSAFVLALAVMLDLRQGTSLPEPTASGRID